MALTPIEEKMLSQAQYGLFNVYYKITLKKAAELREIGFEVTDSKESNESPRLHKIDWNNAGSKIKGVDVLTLDEKDIDYSFPEKLWIIASKVRKDPVKTISNL